jgi:hypothetical protein
VLTYRIRSDQISRKSWAVPFGVAEGSDFSLVATVLNNGAVDAVNFTDSGTWTLTVSDSVLNGGTALLTTQAVSSSFVKLTGKATWTITDTISAGWAAGTYNGDIKVVDSGALVTYFPISLKVRVAQ